MRREPTTPVPAPNPSREVMAVGVSQRVYGDPGELHELPWGLEPFPVQLTEPRVTVQQVCWVPGRGLGGCQWTDQADWNFSSGQSRKVYKSQENNTKKCIITVSRGLPFRAASKKRYDVSLIKHCLEIHW